MSRGGSPDRNRATPTDFQPLPALLKLHDALHPPALSSQELQALRRIGKFHDAVGDKVVQALSRGVSLGSAAELAAHLNRKPETVRRWLRKGVLPANIVGTGPTHAQPRGPAKPVAVEFRAQATPRIRGGNRFAAYAGQWVAVRWDEVVAAGTTPADVVNRLRTLDEMAESMFRIPSEDDDPGGVLPR